MLDALLATDLLQHVQAAPLLQRGDLLQHVQVSPHLQRGSPCRTVCAPSSWPWTNKTYFPLGTQPTEMPEQVESQMKGGALRSAVPAMWTHSAPAAWCPVVGGRCPVCEQA